MNNSQYFKIKQLIFGKYWFKCVITVYLAVTPCHFFFQETLDWSFSRKLYKCFSKPYETDEKRTFIKGKACSDGHMKTKQPYWSVTLTSIPIYISLIFLLPLRVNMMRDTTGPSRRWTNTTAAERENKCLLNGAIVSNIITMSAQDSEFGPRLSKHVHWGQGVMFSQVRHFNSSESRKKQYHRNSTPPPKH